MKRESTKTIWKKQDSWRLDEEAWRLKNGRVLHKGHIRHPGSVVLIPLRETKNGLEIILIRQFRYVLNQYILELPAGTRHWDEPPLPCAQRELREETGFRAETFTELGTIWSAPGSSDEQMTLFLATDLTHDPLPADIDEEIELAPMLLADALKIARRGDIWDAKTVVGIWRVAEFLSRRDEE